MYLNLNHTETILTFELMCNYLIKLQEEESFIDMKVRLNENNINIGFKIKNELI